MSVQITSTQPWIDHHLYNQFPSVEDARSFISEEYQIKKGQICAVADPELIGQFGTTITHGHHGLKQNQFIIGHLYNGSLVSKPDERTDTVCPTTWVATSEGLMATEGIANASPKVLHLAKVIEKKANNILQHLLLEPEEKFSKLSITIDPRILCDTNKTYFIETNNKDGSTLTPQQKKDLQYSEKKTIPTYKSIDPPKIGQEDCTTWCSSDCLPDRGNHYYSHMKK